MAESFVFSIAGKVLDNLGSHVLQELSLAWGVRNELRKLENTLSSVQAVLLDAEKQQARNHQLTDWLGKLKDALYDAEDVLNDFEIDALRRKFFRRSIFRKVRYFFSLSNQLAFRIKIGHKIKEVREMFDEIAADRTKFSLTEGLVERAAVYRETHSFVPANEVIGRDHDRENIVDLLMRTNDREKLSVIPIVGIGGLGKTTLTKMAYNDERIVGQFDLRMWVCVSEDFNLEKLIKKILKSAKVADCNNLEIDQLQTRLREIVNDKKYFLVLDDVWNEDRNKWIELRNLLTGGATGSKIIVTTRNESVASVMAASTCKYKLEGLPYENCLSLFLKLAFSAREDADQHSNLVNIGGEIVKKCKGVPLAVRTLGNLLYMKKEERDWIYVRDNDIWKLEQKEDDILPALKLSYDQLPSHLKQCFAYCSIFGKDCEFYSIHLITHWRAQGLIQLSDQNQDLEDLGKKYIEQLWSKGFFQELVYLGMGFRFKMHDLVHDLALLVAKPDCHVSNNSDAVGSIISKKVRHISFPDGYSGGDEIPSWLLQLRHVRSMVFPVDGVGPTDRSFVETCVSRFKFLRALDLSDSSVALLPSSIGSLKYLRLIDLSRNSEIKSLPESICNLVLLETLGLNGCVKLEKLPKDLGKLIRLKTLAITTKERCLPEKEIGRLTSLQFLMISDCPNIEFLLSNVGIRRLSALRTLFIHNCESLVSLPTSGLGYLTTLENLVIGYCEKVDLTMYDHHLYHGEAATAAAAEGIQFQRGLSSLQYLGIFFMPQLVSLPSWVLHGANNLKHMRIEECDNLTSLPEGMCRLTTLNEIRIADCPELISRIERRNGGEWQKISHVPNIYLDRMKIESSH